MTRPPSFLFVMTDQHRVDTLGCYGNEAGLTPNLGTHFPGAMNPTRHPEYVDYLHANGLPGVSMHDEIRGTLPGGRSGHLLAARLDQPVEATFEGKPSVQRNYSRYWSVDTLSEQTWRQLVASYWGYVRLIDDQVGRVLAEVERLGLAETCTTFFTADHGEFTGAHRMHDKGPGMYDDIYRIPAIAQGPGVASGRVDDTFATLTDLTATILELAGCDPSPAVDSRSLVPLLRGERADGWQERVFAEFHGHHFAYPQRMVRDRRHKLVVHWMAAMYGTDEAGR